MFFIVTNGMWQFFFDNDDTDRCQHSFNNTCWKITGDRSCFCKTQVPIESTLQVQLLTRKVSKPKSVIATNTIAIRPAAGPETLTFELLKDPTTIPPIIPVIIPANGGAPLATAIPKQSGKATKKYHHARKQIRF